MKKFLLLIIDIYQSFISVALKNVLGVQKMCRHSPTCSEYAKISINKNGIFQGLQKSAIRILKCQPFFPVS
ncbi:MAG: hypothetical protein A3B47_04310 [Candidatus Levybacteria bacterium RIFCSPLOWO2_01_FULL_39_24]|nr:MAG: hypothetical protein A2800_04500 [Candidatus Levybacteria bacterium RIFCSPHIGHO2_01_FULL_40_16]OGH45889.1 MAG: hypothetical protein A3B47_04310 [Candidatus Levybacteria bacterium RIFCSPLOWO2_01_FULL_39_24]